MKHFLQMPCDFILNSSLHPINVWGGRICTSFMDILMFLPTIDIDFFIVEIKVHVRSMGYNTKPGVEYIL